MSRLVSSRQVTAALRLLAANRGKMNYLADLGGFAFAAGQHAGHISADTIDELEARGLARIRVADGHESYLALTADGADLLNRQRAS
jgi:hypothetical protein